MSQHNWQHHATHVAHALMHTQRGHQVAQAAAGTAIVAGQAALAAAAAAPLLPIVALGGAALAAYKLAKKS